MNDFKIKDYLLFIGSTLVLALFGFLIHPFFTQLSFFQLNEVKIYAVETGTTEKLRWIFCIAFSFMPLLFLALQKMLKLTDFKQKIFAVLAIFIAGIIFWQFKINSLKSIYEKLDPSHYFALEDLNLELYLLLGFIIGAILGGISLYRYKSRN